jgi:2-deoxy-D-gluconate 3-dehydrogenase
MSPGERELSGRVAIVTGAGAGIGAGIAVALAEAGAAVAAAASALPARRASQVEPRRLVDG